MAKNEDASSAKVRVSLDLSQPFFERLEALEQVTHDSKSGVIRHALQLYEYIVEHTIDGWSFKAVDQEGTEKDLVFFGPYVPPKRAAKAEEDALV